MFQQPGSTYQAQSLVETIPLHTAPGGVCGPPAGHGLNQDVCVSSLLIRPALCVRWVGHGYCSVASCLSSAPPRPEPSTACQATGFYLFWASDLFDRNPDLTVFL